MGPEALPPVPPLRRPHLAAGPLAVPELREVHPLRVQLLHRPRLGRRHAGAPLRLRQLQLDLRCAGIGAGSSGGHSQAAHLLLSGTYGVRQCCQAVLCEVIEEPIKRLA